MRTWGWWGGGGRGTASGTKEDRYTAKQGVGGGAQESPHSLASTHQGSGVCSVPGTLRRQATPNRPAPVFMEAQVWQAGAQKGRGGHRTLALSALIRGHLLTSLLPAAD